MLRRILVTTHFEPEIPITKNSELDIALLRAAHQALLRQQQCVAEAWLFVISGNTTNEEAVDAIAAYGFPDVQILTASTTTSDGETVDYYSHREQIGYLISQWLKTNHPGAVPFLYKDEHDCHDIWWSGVEAIEDEWDFVDDYGATLPGAHRKTAGTWLEILALMLDLEVPCWASVNQLTLYAATLCEWLHGFEAASGNSCNGFEADAVCEALKIDDFYLGFLLGQSSTTEAFDEILYDAETDDLVGTRNYALKQLIANERATLRNLLSKYFGSDCALLWALHSAIWQKFNEPAADLCNTLVNPSAWEDMAEINDSWEFVTNGWTDSADE
ncbi:MAG: hypothetical protein M0T70_11745 [Geobacteraceae bacterium]|nr:hypothetical protein [Geobacteraceae bacterium]